MPEPDLIELFVHPLDRLQFRYLVNGSVASMLYGEPRVTHDVDLVVFLRPADVPKLSEAYPCPDFCVPPVEAIECEVSRRQKGQFNVIHIATALKADIHLTKRDEFHAWAFRNMRRYTVAGREIRLAPPEYVIVRKLEYYRDGGTDKHLRDIRSMLKISGELIDRTALDEWIRLRGVQKEWHAVGA